MRPILLLLLTALVATPTVDAFTFMKGWKLPGRDRGARIAKQTFGDKSENKQQAGAARQQLVRSAAGYYIFFTFDSPHSLRKITLF